MSAPGLGRAPSSHDIMPSATSGQANEEKEVCWICLDDSSTKPLVNPCKCPRKVHATCLATWQLHRANKTEERQCRFCFTTLPPAFEAFQANDTVPSPEKELLAAVVYNNQVYRIPIKPGPEGRAEFKLKVKQLFNLSSTQFECTFDTKLPNSNDKLSLRGLDAYETATRCAALSAMNKESNK